MAARSRHARAAAICLISGGLVFAAYFGVRASVPEPWTRNDWRSSTGGTSVVSTPQTRSHVRWSFTAQNRGASLHTSTQLTISAVDEWRPDHSIQGEPLAKLRAEFTRFATGVIDDPDGEFERLMTDAQAGTQQTGLQKTITVAFPERRFADGLLTTLLFGMIPGAIAILAGHYHLLMLFDDWRKQRAAAKYGACVHCCYSLDGLDASAPCPECGRTPSV